MLYNFYKNEYLVYYTEDLTNFCLESIEYIKNSVNISVFVQISLHVKFNSLKNFFFHSINKSMTKNIFLSSFIELKAKYNSNYKSQFFNFVRCSLKILNFVILILLNSSRVIILLLFWSLFFIWISDKLLILIVFSLLLSFALRIEIQVFELNIQ